MVAIARSGEYNAAVMKLGEGFRRSLGAAALGAVLTFAPDSGVVLAQDIMQEPGIEQQAERWIQYKTPSYTLLYPESLPTLVTPAVLPRKGALVPSRLDTFALPSGRDDIRDTTISIMTAPQQEGDTIDSVVVELKNISQKRPTLSTKITSVEGMNMVDGNLAKTFHAHFEGVENLRTERKDLDQYITVWVSDGRVLHAIFTAAPERVEEDLVVYTEMLSTLEMKPRKTPSVKV